MAEWAVAWEAINTNLRKKGRQRRKRSGRDQQDIAQVATEEVRL